jgi:phosphoglycerate dehydrogenase-like enzyme
MTHRNDGDIASDRIKVGEPLPRLRQARTARSHTGRGLLTPHVSGTTLEAQRRYAKGVRECLAAFLAGDPLPEDFHVAGPERPERSG